MLGCKGKSGAQTRASGWGSWEAGEREGKGGDDGGFEELEGSEVDSGVRFERRRGFWRRSRKDRKSVV